MADAAAGSLPSLPPRRRWLDTADLAPQAGAEWGDADVPIIDERPLFTQARELEGGPYSVMPDGAEQVPTNFYSGIDSSALVRAVKLANEMPPQVVTSEGTAPIPGDQRSLLKSGSEAGKLLLDTIDRGANASSNELERAVMLRMRGAGLI